MLNKAATRLTWPAQSNNWICLWFDVCRLYLLRLSLFYVISCFLYS